MKIVVRSPEYDVAEANNAWLESDRLRLCCRACRGLIYVWYGTARDGRYLFFESRQNRFQVGEYWVTGSLSLMLLMHWVISSRFVI